MNRKNQKPYLFILAVLLVLMSISLTASEKLRGVVVATLTPLWISLTPSDGALNSDGELQKTKIEMQLVKNELQRMRELLKQELRLNRQLTALPRQEREVEELDELMKEHYAELRKQIALQLQALPARVIFRSPSSWNSSVWLNVGENDNKAHGKAIIAKNSPVIVGNCVVGVVDYVGKQQCRVRLITDSGLTPSVRAVRGDLQQKRTADELSDVVEVLAQDPYGKTPEGLKLQQQLKQACETLQENPSENFYLAKGELRGSSKPLWRSLGTSLRGIGFNYDFADEYGPARDLRSGAPVTHPKEAAIPLLKVNDLLVTTGMDGVFPPGLQVAVITKIETLKEGDYYYELEARPTAHGLHQLNMVYVLPPVGFDADDKPPFIGM
ncbi:MAG: rod shape-determining protein MreC [Parachlamydiaceae bacterium]|nr:rod shape-determining protein MreC [Parachlamydiaceae bacterium]